MSLLPRHTKIAGYCLAAVLLFAAIAGAEPPSRAPLDPAFERVQQKKVVLSAPVTADDHPLGYRPGPIDLSRVKASARQKQLLAMLPPPASYDLRNYSGKLSPIRNQGSCGSCWSFGTYGSMESCLRPGEVWDFSEMDLICNHGFDYSQCAGGSNMMPVAYLARWNGPVDEGCYPYAPPTCTVPRPACATQKRVQDVIFLPRDNTAIKTAVQTYGAVYTTFSWQNDAYNPATYSFYYSGTEASNHAVCIVGWDDNYPRANFTAPLPSANGAWIMRNSWGTGWGQSGYFYMSYQDTHAGEGAMVYSNVGPTANYSRSYDYDPLGWTASYGYGSDTAWFANMFTAEGNEQIAAVSTYVSQPGSSYELYIYSDCAAASPRSGMLAASASGVFPDAGYHTLPLGLPAGVIAGQRFSVVLKLTTPGDVYPIPAEYRWNGYSSAAEAGPGESFASSDGASWQDVTSYAPNTNNCLKAFALPAGPIPTISGVSATNPDGGYGTGGIISIQVIFTGRVNVTGAPKLALATSPGRQAGYISGTGTSTLVFNYVVQPGDSASDLDYTSATALSLNGGTITSITGGAAVLTLPSPGTIGSLSFNKNIRVDGNAPTVTNVSAENANGIYSAGTAIRIEVFFSQGVKVTGTPRITLATTPTRYAAYASGTSSNRLVFTYVVQPGDSAADLDYSGPAALSLEGGSIVDTLQYNPNPANLAMPNPGAAGSLGYNKNIQINATAPLVVNVTATNENGTYAVGAVIGIQLVFNQIVQVSGAPQLALATTPSRIADYSSGGGTNTLVFNYVVQPDDAAADLDYASTAALSLNGGSIRDVLENNADLTLSPPGAVGSLGYSKDIVIDANAPQVQEWMSARMHQMYDVLAITLDAQAAVPNVETRVGGIQWIVATFNREVVLANPAAVVITGRSMVDGVLQAPVEYSASASVELLDATILSLTFPEGALPDRTCYKIELAGAIQGTSGRGLIGPTSITIRSLAGDTTGNGSVNLGDALYIRSAIGTTDPGTAPWLDINLDGQIDMDDVLAGKGLISSPAVAACP